MNLGFSTNQAFLTEQPPCAVAKVRSCVKRLYPLFSSTSWKEGCISFGFINIVERRKADIFSPCVFNNLMKIDSIFYTFFSSGRRGQTNYFNFNHIDFREVFLIHC